jgi:antitoxin YobK
MQSVIEEITQLINRFSETNFFVGKATNEIISQIQKELNVELPEDYKWFLIQYGHGIINGHEIQGCGLSAPPSCVETTLYWRQFYLPESFVVIEDNGDGWIMCLNTSQIHDKKCSVVDWESGIGIGQLFYPSFFDYLEFILKGN